MNILVGIVLGIILGLVGDFGLNYFNINVSYFDYKYSFKKALNQNMEFFLSFSALAGIVTAIGSILIGQHIGLATLVSFAIYGFVFTLFFFLIFSVWIYFSFKVLKTESHVFILALLFFIIIFFLLSLL